MKKIVLVAVCACALIVCSKKSGDEIPQTSQQEAVQYSLAGSWLLHRDGGIDITLNERGVSLYGNDTMTYFMKRNIMTFTYKDVTEQVKIIWEDKDAMLWESITYPKQEWKAIRKRAPAE